MQKFLIIQTAFTGDVVLATCLVEKLHAFFPQARIDFLLRKGNEGLLKNHPFIGETLIWNKKEGKYKSMWKLLQKIRTTKYDKVINIQRFAATGFLTAFSGAAETIGFNKNPLSFLFSKKIPHFIGDKNHQPHEVERNLTLIEHFTDNSIFKPALYPSTEDMHVVAGYKKQPYICVAPASVWFTKQYPAAKWISFINQVPDDYQVYLLGAPGEAGLCSSIAEGSNRLVTSLAGKLSFLESAALMRDASMNYTNDSAPMHFASATNAPITAVYCSTVPSFGYGPLADNSGIVETREQLPCRPCGLHGYRACPLKHFRCAHTISDVQLLQRLPDYTKIVYRD